MMNISNIILQINNNPAYVIKAEEIYVYNCVRLSHGDKMFTNLIDNLGISASYGIDPITNSIPPASASRWYFFAIPQGCRTCSLINEKLSANKEQVKSSVCM